MAKKSNGTVKTVGVVFGIAAAVVGAVLATGGYRENVKRNTTDMVEAHSDIVEVRRRADTNTIAIVGLRKDMGYLLKAQTSLEEKVDKSTERILTELKELRK